MSGNRPDLAEHLALALRRTGGYSLPAPLVEATAPRNGGSRRRRLWDLPHRLHCPVVGVCFACDELRVLMRKVMHFPHATSDYVLHTTAVGNCEQRCQLAELLQRTLEQRYRLTVKALAAMKSCEELRCAWQRACRDGVEIPATLWACWTHPALDDALEQEIFGDIHMLQHQLGSGTRADLDALQALHRENRELRGELSKANAELAQLRAERATLLNDATREAVDLRAELTAANANGERLAGELAGLRHELPALREAQAVRRRLASVEIQAEAGRQRVQSLQREVERLRDFARHAEETIDALSSERADPPVAVPGRDLCGKRVLCVGGRSGALNSYREVVEQSGGEFLHHDGGLEESLQRIDSVVAAADIVICQAGCISHNAYWRVKEHCKRTGKRCIFLKSAGVASFDKAVGEAGGAVD